MFRLDVSERQLTRLDGRQNGNLPEKAFQTLCILVRNRGRLVTKDDLLRQVWPDSFVEENNLDKCIHLIRHTLGQNLDGEKYVETIRKHGYRFVAEVKRAGVNAADGSAHATWPTGKLEEGEHIPSIGEGSPSLWSLRTQRWVLLAALIGIAALALGASLYSWLPAVGPPMRTIAILPLKPVNPETSDPLYELGMAEALINKIGTAKGLAVKPLSAVRSYTAVDMDPVAVGRERGFDYVLAPNYQLAQGKLRVTAQLFNVGSGAIEETYVSEKEIAGIFALQDAVANDMGNRLLVHFAAVAGRPAAPTGTDNEEAYRLYLQGMYFYAMRERSGAREAVEVLKHAVALDPNYARAWAGLAHAHRSVGNFGRSVDNREQYERSVEAINRALALDSGVADAYSALCENKMYYEYDFVGAERECKRAIELDPNSALAHQVYSRYLSSRGRFDEAIAEARTAVDLDPSSLFNQRHYGFALQLSRRYEEAVVQFKRVTAMKEDFFTTYPFLSMTLALMGKESEAFEWFMKWQTLPRPSNKPSETGDLTRDRLIRTYQSVYQTGGWMAVMRERARRFDESDQVYFHGAAFNALIGEKDRAFEYLEKSYQRREHWMAYLNVDPRLDSLRDDPRYIEMVKRVESRSN